MARSPAIVPLRNNDLTALNRFATAVRQRLDQIDTEFVSNPVTQAQLGALQAAVQRIRNDLDSMASEASGSLIETNSAGVIAIRHLRLPGINIADGSIPADGAWDSRGTRWIPEP